MGNHFVNGEGGNCIFMGKEWRIILSENVLDREQGRKEEKEKEWGKVLKE